MKPSQAIEEALSLVQQHADLAEGEQKKHYEEVHSALNMLKRIAAINESKSSKTTETIGSDDAGTEPATVEEVAEEPADNAKNVKSLRTCDDCGLELNVHPVTLRVPDEDGETHQHRCKGKVAIADVPEDELKVRSCKDCGVKVGFTDETAENAACFGCNTGPLCPRCIRTHGVYHNTQSVEMKR